jgi:hypothetical protein
MAAPPTLADTLRLPDSRRGGHASAAHCVRDGMSHLCFQWRPDPSKSACGPRSVFLITLPTPQGRALVGAHPVSGTVGRGHGACATSWASPISACRNGGGPRHRPSPRSAPQAPLASAPPLVEEVTATSTYHTQTTAWQPQRGAGICYQRRVAPCGFTHRENLAWYTAGRPGYPQTAAVAVYVTAVLHKARERQGDTHRAAATA